MKYTIDVAVDSLWTTHRLKKDGMFKKFTAEHEKEILEDDSTFDDYFEAKRWISNNKFIKVEEKQIEVDPVISDLGYPIVSVKPHRTGKPKQSYFTEEQLRQVLLSGDDTMNNSLIVDFDGFLNLVPFPQAKNGPYAVRHESFVAGNGYVGKETNLYHLEDTYLSLLEGWSTHLGSHDMEYVDCPSGQTREELINEITEAINVL